MTMIISYKTKTALHAAVGRNLRARERSSFHREYPNKGNGTVTVAYYGSHSNTVTPIWSAEVTLRNHIITDVK